MRRQIFVCLLDVETEEYLLQVQDSQNLLEQSLYRLYSICVAWRACLPQRQHKFMCREKMLS